MDGQLLQPRQPLIKQFPQPFAYILYNYQTEHYCSYCLRSPAKPHEQKLRTCSSCHLARYCDRDCQRQAWSRDHKAECARLKTAFPNLPLSDVLLLARVVSRLGQIEKEGDEKRGWMKERRFEDLLGHERETRLDAEKMHKFERIYEKSRKFIGDQAMVEKERFFGIFCRVWINSHSIHASVGTEIGMALDLGVSRYDHSCRPNATLVFDGFRATMRPLLPNMDAADHRTTFISYVDVGRSKYQRRRQLWSQWYFHCECERCTDPAEDRLTSIRCSNSSCPDPILITEETEPVDTVCPKCQSPIPAERISAAQTLMNSVPAKLSTSPSPEWNSEKARGLLDEAKKQLHPENIYLNRLITAYTELTGGQDEERSGIDELIRVYENYKRYYPTYDRHVGYHLLHLIKAMIDRGRRSDATQYAFHAMNIFEVCFGIEHPYYLKTLALWTYLDTKAEKSDRELFELMNFNYNRPIDLSSLIE